LASHSCMLFPAFASETRGISGDGLLNAFKYSPLHAFAAGTQAVILFFVLSGFVLALPFLTDRKPRYRSFVVKRWMRLYPPFYVAVLLAMALATIVSTGHIGGLSEWFNTKWQSSVTAGSAAKHALLIDSFRNDTYDPVLWSLVYEMRVSLIFPLLVWA